MKHIMLVLAALAVIGLAFGGCKKGAKAPDNPPPAPAGENKAPDNPEPAKPDEAKPDEAKADEAKADEAKGDESLTGVKECDDFMAKYEKCVGSLSGPAGDAAKKAMATMRDGYKKSAAAWKASPAASKAAADGCKKSMDMMKKSMPKCEW